MLGIDGPHARVIAQPDGERVQRLAGLRTHDDEPDLRDGWAARPRARAGDDGVRGGRVRDAARLGLEGDEEASRRGLGARAGRHHHESRERSR